MKNILLLLILTTSKLNYSYTTPPYAKRHPLHHLAFWGNCHMLERLIISGEYTTEDVDGSGRTPLHLAAINGSKDAVDTLLGLDAKVYALDRNLYRPEDTARHHGHIELANLLAEYRQLEEARLIEEHRLAIIGRRIR